jgi:porin
VTPWLQVQPDFQYVFNPGDGILNPDNPTQRIGNELILGTRATITF